VIVFFLLYHIALAMTSVLRDTPFGQLVRYVTKGRYLQYPEEIPGFQIPWLQDVATDPVEHTNVGNQEVVPASTAEKELEATEPSNIRDGNMQNNRSSASEIDININGAGARLKEYQATVPSHSSEKPIQHPSRPSMQTRQSTDTHPAEQLDVERQVTATRTQSNIITPKRTAEGIILIDWYSSDDAENPQNWSATYKSFVTFLIVAYTFVVYTGSSIYITAEPQVMEKFGISTSKASLGLSMYIFGYGFGPLVSCFHPTSSLTLG
jgi:MFS transporter, DHA1 family, multidrug resistance protein